MLFRTRTQEQPNPTQSLDNVLKSGHAVQNQRKRIGSNCPAFKLGMGLAEYFRNLSNPTVCNMFEK